MLDSIDPTAAGSAEDDVLEVTDKNYQKIAENLERVISSRISLFCLQMTSLFSPVTERASLRDVTRFFKNPSTKATRTASG